MTRALALLACWSNVLYSKVPHCASEAQSYAVSGSSFLSHIRPSSMALRPRYERNELQPAPLVHQTNVSPTQAYTFCRGMTQTAVEARRTATSKVCSVFVRVHTSRCYTVVLYFTSLARTTPTGMGQAPNVAVHSMVLRSSCT